MEWLATGSVILIIILHIAFLVLEMFLWTTPSGMKIFGLSPTEAKMTRVLAQNQGLYNGFLALGLFWGLWQQDYQFKFFFLGCMVVAGIFGAFTANHRIFFIQALPASLSALLVYLEYVA
jgi:putative membrane protein